MTVRNHIGSVGGKRDSTTRLDQPTDIDQTRSSHWLQDALEGRRFWPVVRFYTYGLLLASITFALVSFFAYAEGILLFCGTLFLGLVLLLALPEGRKRVDSPKIPVWKRLLDVTCIVLALPILVPVIAGISSLIYLASPGPVLWASERIGYRGRRFRCFKFRTIRVNTNESVHQKHLAQLMKSDAPMTKMDAKGDPRVIPFGSFLRATGLDELPQLLNVIGGEMSIVGPRPCLPYEYENYTPAQKRRFDSLPGLTGLWQVSGKNMTTFSEMIALDIKYSETMSPWLDLKLMIKTLPAMLTQVMQARSRRQIAQAGSKSNETIQNSSVQIKESNVGVKPRSI